MRKGVKAIPKAKEIKMRPIKSETLSPKEFVRVKRDDIERAKVIPPRIGSNSLGRIKVEYKHLKFKPV